MTILMLVLLNLFLAAFLYLALSLKMEKYIDAGMKRKIRQDFIQIIDEFNQTAKTNISILEDRIRQLRRAVDVADAAERTHEVILPSDKIRSKQSVGEKEEEYQEHSASNIAMAEIRTDSIMAVDQSNQSNQVGQIKDQVNMADLNMLENKASSLPQPQLNALSPTEDRQAQLKKGGHGIEMLIDGLVFIETSILHRFGRLWAKIKTKQKSDLSSSLINDKKNNQKPIIAPKVKALHEPSLTSRSANSIAISLKEAETQKLSEDSDPAILTLKDNEMDRYESFSALTNDLEQSDSVESGIYKQTAPNNFDQNGKLVNEKNNSYRNKNASDLLAQIARQRQWHAQAEEIDKGKSTIQPKDIDSFLQESLDSSVTEVSHVSENEMGAIHRLNTNTNTNTNDKNSDSILTNEKPIEKQRIAVSEFIDNIGKDITLNEYTSILPEDYWQLSRGERFQHIAKLVQQGVSVKDLSALTKMSFGEIELIASLNRNYY